MTIVAAKVIGAVVVAVALIGACVYLAGKVSDWIDSGLEEMDIDK